MYRLISILFYCSCLTAQQIQYYPTANTFWDDEIVSPYIELNVAIDVNTLEINRKSNFFLQKLI